MNSDLRIHLKFSLIASFSKYRKRGQIDTIFFSLDHLAHFRCVSVLEIIHKEIAQN